MKLLQIFPILVIVMTMGACSSAGFNRGELQAQLETTSPVYSDKDIQAEFKKKANLPKPFKLAVFFKVPPGYTDWRWTEEDRASFNTLTQDLQSQGLVSTVIPILTTLVDKDDLKSLRKVAAQHQADALLIVEAAGAVSRRLNKWGWTYTLLLPTLFVNGSQSETLFIAQSALWDVRNEFLYLSASAESQLEDNYAALMGASDKELLQAAKVDALAQLKIQLIKMIQGTKF